MISAAANTSGLVFGAAPPNRARAFAAARRHSARVRWLKRLLILAMTGGTAALVLFAIYDPFRVLPSSVSIGEVSLSGTRITMDLPKLSGFRNDGRPYQVTAKSASQDIRSPSLVDLSELEADVGMADKSRAHVTAQSGHFDSTKEFLNLNTNVTLKAENGYDVALETVDIDFHAGSMVSNRPVKVVMKNGSVNADRMTISENGKRLMFEGNVHSILLPAPEAVEDAKKLKGSQP